MTIPAERTASSCSSRALVVACVQDDFVTVVDDCLCDGEAEARCRSGDDDSRHQVTSVCVVVFGAWLEVDDVGPASLVAAHEPSSRSRSSEAVPGWAL